MLDSLEIGTLRELLLNVGKALPETRPLAHDYIASLREVSARTRAVSMSDIRGGQSLFPLCPMAGPRIAYSARDRLVFILFYFFLFFLLFLNAPSFFFDPFVRQPHV